MAPSTLAEGETGYQCITQLGEAQVAYRSRVRPGEQPSSTLPHPPMGARSQNCPPPPYSPMGAESQKPTSQCHASPTCRVSFPGAVLPPPPPGTPQQVYTPGSQVHLGSVEALRPGGGLGLLCPSVSPESGRGPSTRSPGPSPASSLETLCLPRGLRQR